MNVAGTIGGVFGLGIAGLDPIGALIALPALASGARRRVIVIFFTAALVTTVATGVALGESVQYVIAWLTEVLTVPDPLRLTLQLAGAAGLGYWAARRWRDRNKPKPEKKKPHASGVAGMGLLGIAWGASSLTDPTFFGVAAIGATLPGVVPAALAYAGWFLVSQAPLAAVALTLAAGRDSAPVRRVSTIARRLARPTSHMFTALLGLAAIALAINAVTYLLAGSFWPF